MNPSPSTSSKLKVAIKTFGCQMNEYDSQVAAGLLKAAGFEITEKAPDVVLMNTCSVREHAEDRVWSQLGRLGRAKQANPRLIVGLLGCMVEEHREKLFRRFPQLDLMVGTRNLKELPSLIEEVAHTRRQAARIRRDGISIEYTDLIQRTSKYHAWLPIMTGCNKVCTFCIVPITRGPEVSMPEREVYREASRLALEGVKWITLLGQNVNSYNGIQTSERYQVPLSEKVPGTFRLSTADSVSFPQLLEMLCQIEGLERISFTTSHPSDATEELFGVIAANPKISRRFHLPLQSGSDRVLKRMKRLHTYADYKMKIERLRALVPDISITTDILSGFSGESEEDHEATKRALREIRYDGAYIFKYSVRPGTPAAKLADDVPLEIKERRNAELLALQKKLTEENNRAWVGRTVTVFADGPSRKDPSKLVGRSRQEKRVVFDGSSEFIGTFQQVTLLEVSGETFRGELRF